MARPVLPAKHRMEAMIKQHGYDMAQAGYAMLSGQMACQTCMDDQTGESSGKVTWLSRFNHLKQIPPVQYHELGLLEEMTDCPSCLGTGKTKLDSKEILYIWKEMLKYQMPALSSLDITADDEVKRPRVNRWAHISRMKETAEAVEDDSVRARLRRIVAATEKVEAEESID